MELGQLAYVVAIAEEGQFTRAAGRLLVAQPAVSAQIRRLERELGEVLFRRDRRSVSLTDAGDALLPTPGPLWPPLSEGVTRSPPCAAWCEDDT